MFLAMVMEMQSRNNREFSEREVLQWGKTMQKVIKVNLAPYKDFVDPMEHGKPDYGKRPIETCTVPIRRPKDH
jgi:hypothetical protein